jgi:hypothetical protein
VWVSLEARQRQASHQCATSPKLPVTA